MNQSNIIKERIAELQAQLPAEKAWWENKRAGIQSDLMKELEADGNGKAVEPVQRKVGSDDDAVLVEAGGPANAQGGKKKKKKQQQQQQAQQQLQQQPTPPAE
jgi:translocation protein SEC66